MTFALFQTYCARIRICTGYIGSRKGSAATTSRPFRRMRRRTRPAILLCGRPFSRDGSLPPPGRVDARAFRPANLPEMPSFEFVLAGRYKLVAPLGEGGMAAVYRGRDLRLNREVAIKILHDDLTRDRAYLARFEREAQTVASLSHPNIVPVYDVGEDGTTRFIVMEYVRGKTLRDSIELQGLIPPDRAVAVLLPVLDALGYAHAQGLIHRDVKPQNILIATDGTPRLADFGIAHLADGSATRTAAILGSAQYLSPEQSRGEEASPRSDLYACGIVLYEMLTGKPPFEGPNALAIAHQHLHAVPPRIGGTGNMGGIVARALEKDPEARFQSAHEFAQALRDVPAA